MSQGCVAELMLKYLGKCLLRPVKADQSEQTALFGSWSLKETVAETELL